MHAHWSKVRPGYKVLVLSPPRVSSQSQSVIGNMETPPAAGNVATISSWC